MYHISFVEQNSKISWLVPLSLLRCPSSTIAWPEKVDVLALFKQMVAVSTYGRWPSKPDELVSTLLSS